MTFIEGESIYRGRKGLCMPGQRAKFLLQRNAGFLLGMVFVL